MTWQQDFQSDIKLLWLFGLVRVRFPTLQSKTPFLESEELALESEELAQEIDRVGHSSRKNQHIVTIVRQKAFRQRVIKFIGDFWRAVHKRDINLRVRLGLGDPADTGQLWAFVGPVAGILANTKEASIEIIPEFFDTTIELDSSGNIRIFPLQMIYLAVGLLLSPPIWQGINQMRTVE